MQNVTEREGALGRGKWGHSEEAVLGKHPDLLVGPLTATVFPTNDRKYKISQFFAKNFEKI